MKKTILINFFVLFFLLILGEFFFGTWFKSNNFGTHLRGHINAKVKMNTSIGGIKKEFIFLEIQMPLEIMKFQIVKLTLFL